MRAHTLLILGVNSTLAGAFLEQLKKPTHYYVLGIDRQEKASYSQLTDYMMLDFSQTSIQQIGQELPLDFSGELVFISCIGRFGDRKDKHQGRSRLSTTDVLAQINVNLMYVTSFCCEVINRCLYSGGKCRIVIVGSSAAWVGSRDIGYGIAKAGLNGLVLSLSKSFATQGITVLGVNPGIFDSLMANNVSPERQQDAIRSTHIKRAGQVDEIASVLNYAALEAPDYMTGAILSVNGGQYT
ncbi:SDR family NAD(P)-dependent oxidoreductase [Zooshikella ganghwensis]|uniref:SDR family oxidoreductase n=1 Tax=Zooshikella ganghwensis TaxID=202772 RepID=A0A4P9VLY6_9GAMM|nr:SDR family oxidoreductase [Zooshikella ganghwensis]RDH43367.1 SDR family oxidoreductase [Zooshikella ganghwensis]